MLWAGSLAPYTQKSQDICTSFNPSLLDRRQDDGSVHAVPPSRCPQRSGEVPGHCPEQAGACYLCSLAQRPAAVGGHEMVTPSHRVGRFRDWLLIKCQTQGLTVTGSE